MKEHQHIDWKETWQDKYLKWICGFANAEGGKLVIGRNDQGIITGLPNAFLRACSKADLPPPELRYEQTGLWVIFSFSLLDKEEVAVKMAVKKAVKIPDKILKILEENPSMSLKEVPDNIGKSLRVVERACAELKKQGALIRVGTPRCGHWQVTVKKDGINDGKTKS